MNFKLDTDLSHIEDDEDEQNVIFKFFNKKIIFFN